MVVVLLLVLAVVLLVTAAVLEVVVVAASRRLPVGVAVLAVLGNLHVSIVKENDHQQDEGDLLVAVDVRGYKPTKMARRKLGYWRQAGRQAGTQRQIGKQRQASKHLSYWLAGWLAGWLGS